MKNAHSVIFCMFFLVCLFCKSVLAMSNEEKAFLNKIEAIKKDEVLSNTTFLVACLKIKGLPSIRKAAFHAIAGVRHIDLVSELVEIACCEQSDIELVSCCIEYLAGVSEVIQSEQVLKLISCHKNSERGTCLPIVSEIAGNSRIDLVTTRKILELFSQKSFRVAIVVFCKRQLDRKDPDFLDAIRPVLLQFLLKISASEDIRSPQGLQFHLAICLGTHKIQGAGTVIYQVLKSEMKKYDQTNEMDPSVGVLIRVLEDNVGVTRGYDFNMPPIDPNNLRVIQVWLAWLNEPINRNQ